MDGNLWTTTTDAREALLDRRTRVDERLQRIRRKRRGHAEPLPRDEEDAAVILENDRILRAIEDSASRELDELERELMKLRAAR
jgi:hypothetical protein